MVLNSPVNLGDRNDVICKAFGGKSARETILLWGVWVCVFMGLVHQTLCVGLLGVDCSTDMVFAVSDMFCFDVMHCSLL